MLAMMERTDWQDKKLPAAHPACGHPSPWSAKAAAQLTPALHHPKYLLRRNDRGVCLPTIARGWHNLASWGATMSIIEWRHSFSVALIICLAAVASWSMAQAQDSTLAVDEQNLRSERLTMAIRLSERAKVLEDAGRPGQAESLYRRALAIDEKILGPENWPWLPVSMS